MGGCRCTYRNCTVKSDGKTHMFHYPVFEKVRCHQWLLNAHRLDFLDLKVSQLKNRVVCQHHFRDDNFMNFKKDKLTFDAIPTEDGPYCDTANYVDLNPDSSKIFSIIIDDTENDYITGNGKKANYPIKYGDFLANLDLMDLEKIDEDCVSYKNINNSVDIFSPYKSRDKSKLSSEDGSFSYNITLPDKNDKKCATHPTLAVPPYKSDQYEYTLNEVHPHCLQLNSKDNKITTYGKHNISVGNVPRNAKPNQEQQAPQKKETKVKIISEKTITEAVPIAGKFKPVPPNFLLNVPKIKRKVAAESLLNNSSSLCTEYKETPKEHVNKVIEITEYKETPKEHVNKVIEIEVEPIIKEEDSSKALKPKVTPERVEAINKKRLFNMKLRDMVESCLDNLEKGDKHNEQNDSQKQTKTKSNKRKIQQVRCLPKTTPSLSTQEPTMAFLEERMKKMENTLLEKIEQNSQKIIDLKNTFSQSSDNKRISQTKVDVESHKKKLFQEIAQYLSPSSKSLIYEELFINKFSLNEPISLHTNDSRYKRQRRK